MGKWQKGLGAQNSAKGSRGDRRWTLLFIGDRSKTVAFNHLKAVVIITAFVILALAGIAAGLGYLYRSAIVDIRTLNENLENANQSIISLRDEKDILMAKLVMAESRVDGSPSQKDKNPSTNVAEAMPDELSAQEETQPPSSPQVPPEETGPVGVEVNGAVYHKVEPGDSLYLIGLSYGVSVNLLRQYNDLKDDNMIRPGQMLVVKPASGSNGGEPAKEVLASRTSVPKTGPASAQESDPEMKVDAEKLSTFFEPGEKFLRVEYVLRNTGEKKRPIAGQTVVVLKGVENAADIWLALPSVPLESGRPKGSEGYSFSIRNYRTMRFKTGQGNAHNYSEAVVYVFTTGGDLVLEKQFPVRIPGPNNTSSGS